MWRSAIHVGRGRESYLRNARIMQGSNLGKALAWAGLGSWFGLQLIGVLTWSYPARVEPKTPSPTNALPVKRTGQQGNNREIRKDASHACCLNSSTPHHDDFLRIWSYIRWAVEWLPVFCSVCTSLLEVILWKFMLLWEFYIFVE